MNCGHCTKTITEALLALDHELIIKTDIEQKTVSVTTPTESVEKEGLKTESIKNTIIDAGYEVTAVFL
jgi:copper chaperone CopZ